MSGKAITLANTQKKIVISTVVKIVSKAKRRFKLERLVIEEINLNFPLFQESEHLITVF